MGEVVGLAETVKNTTLEATVLVNLGTANRDLGNRTQSVEYYRRSSQWPTREATSRERPTASPTPVLADWLRHQAGRGFA
jgi:hypothetical protein